MRHDGKKATMDTDRVDRLSRAISSRLSRRSLAGVFGLAPFALPGLAGARKKRKKHRKACKGGKQKCGKHCIPKAHCCTDADCGPLFLCAHGTCVIGQGTCPTGLDGCQTGSNVCGQVGEEPCSCFQSTVGETRCAAGLILPQSTCGECINDPDCRQLYPDVTGVFCARGGPNCGCPSPNSGFCQAPCPDQS
jgi:hypothetical protein